MMGNVNTVRFDENLRVLKRFLKLFYGFQVYFISVFNEIFAEISTVYLV